MVRRERAVLDQNLVALRGGRIEAHHEQVEVDGQPVHRHHFVGVGAGQSSKRVGEQLVVVLPCQLTGEVAFDAECGPTVDLGLDRATSTSGQGAERIAHQVDAIGKLKLAAKTGQRVSGVELCGGQLCRVIVVHRYALIVVA